MTGSTQPPVPSRRAVRHAAGREGAAHAPHNTFVAEGIPLGSDGAQIAVRVVNGSPSAGDIAAVTAVLTAALVEQAGAQDAVPQAAESAWQRSRRRLRTPLEPGAGRFSSWA
ncbi:hypothetical protein GCM10027416_06420 [Okibacterium endophyticum]